MKSLASLFLCYLFSIQIFAQKTAITGHSHNDYEQKRPFKAAFAAKMGSIEADVHLVNGNLYVAHDAKDIKPNNTLESLYLKPLSEAAEKGELYPFILLIDIKSNADSTTDEVIRQLSHNFNSTPVEKTVQFVISGNRPIPKKWWTYPRIVKFDGRPNEVYSAEEWSCIGMVSESFGKFVEKKGQKTITPVTFDKMKATVNAIHKENKKVRFWGTPDSKKVWKDLAKMGVDFINTDKPEALKRFLIKRN